MSTRLWLIFSAFGVCFAKINDRDYASIPRLFHQDDYDQCMLMGDLYCSFTYQLEPLDRGGPSRTWDVVKELSSDRTNYRHDRLRHWICVPISCPGINLTQSNDLKRGINDCYDKRFYQQRLRGYVEDLRCESNVPEHPVDTFDLIVAFISLSYVSLVVSTSLFEDFEFFNKLPEKSRKLLAVFSLNKNWNRLKTVRCVPEVDKFRALQGIKFYNTFPVVLSHTAFAMFIGPVANLKYTESLTSKLGNLFLSSGALCVSTSFFMSSFFLCYGVLSINKNKPYELKHAFLIYLNRYLRLLPALLAVLLFNATWLRHAINGPLWYDLIQKEFTRCRSNGWTNVLFLNDLIRDDEMCMQHSWYLSQDAQFCVVLLLVLWYVRKYPRRFWTVVSVLLSVNVVGSFVQSYKWGFEAIIVPTPEVLYGDNYTLKNPQWGHQLRSFVGNLSGPILGLICGYLLSKGKDKSFFLDHPRFHRRFFYVFSFGVSLTMTLLPGFLLFVVELPHGIWTQVYSSLSRPVFLLGIAYACFATISGFGGLTKYVLEWPPIYVLGRLSYSAYLVHVPMILIRRSSVRSPLYVNDWLIVYTLMADIAMAYVVGLLVTLFLEMPASGLQKLLLVKGKGEKDH